MAVTVLGVDPGTQLAGWALMGHTSDRQPLLVKSGLWRLGDSRVAMGERLLKLRAEMVTVLTEFRPQRLVLESAFFGKNARSALRLGEARGVILVTAQEFGLQLCEVPPARVKARAAGSGSASKEQVARLVGEQLGVTEFESFDESDAVAVALCGLVEADSPTAGLSRGRSRSGPQGLPKGARFQ